MGFLTVVRHKKDPFNYPIHEQWTQERPSSELLNAAKQLAAKLSKDQTNKKNQFEVFITTDKQ